MAAQKDRSKISMETMTKFHFRFADLLPNLMRFEEQRSLRGRS